MIFRRIYKYLEDSIGLDVDSIGYAGIDNSIRSIMAEHILNNEEELLFGLINSSELRIKLIEMIIVPETWFFRDSKPYDYLKYWLTKNRYLYSYDTLKILSAPCSTGEEPYSIAISLVEFGLTKDSFQIDAIDLSEDSVKKAIDGIYHKVSFRGDDKYFLDKYFTKIGLNRFQLNNDIRGLVNFRRDNILNLKTIQSLEKYHIIFFKNLLIYLTSDARLIVLNKIKQILHPKGVLFTGHTETTYFLRYGFSMIKFPHSFALTLSEIEQSKPKDNVINKIQNKTNIRTSRKVFDDFNHNGTTNKAEQKNETSKPEKRKEINPLERIQDLADKGNFEKALELCIEYSLKNKADENCYFLQGLIFEGMNDKENAIIQYNKVLYLSPYHTNTLLHLSLLYENMGKLNQAKTMKERLSRSIKRS